MISKPLNSVFTLTVLLTVSLSCNAQNLSLGLMAHYPFDGNANDISGNNNNGTLNGPVSVQDRFGTPNSAYYFDGINDEVNINNSPTLNPTAGISISAWYKPVSFIGNGFSPFFTKGYTAHSEPYYQYKLGVYGPTSKFAFAITVNGVRQQIASAATWNPGSWYFVVGTYDGTTMKLYVDGVLNASIAVSGSLTTFTTDVKFGNNTTAADHIAGTIDDTRMYDRALTPAEITILFTNSVGITEKEIESQVSVYPNPVSDYLVIKYGENKVESLKLELLDAIGKIVYSTDTVVDSIDVSSYPEGIYFLKTSTAFNTSYKKIIITR